ncbi:hypothetical protein VTN96DRAFT_10342 [Rasamsonia emersonii]
MAQVVRKIAKTSKRKRSIYQLIEMRIANSRRIASRYHPGIARGLMNKDEFPPPERIFLSRRARPQRAKRLYRTQELFFHKTIAGDFAGCDAIDTQQTGTFSSAVGLGLFF